MQRQRFEVRLGEAAPSFSWLQADGHGGTEHGQPLVEADDVQLMEPHQRPVQQLPGIPRLAIQSRVGRYGPQQVAHGGFRQQIRAPDSTGQQAAQQMVQHLLGPHAAPVGCLFKGRPFALQGHPHRLRILFAHRPTAPCAVLAPSVIGNASNNAPQP